MPTDSQQNSLQKQAYLRIRDMVVNGELAPGEPVVERQLAEKLGVSRMPVREALVELEKEGLVQKIGSRTRIVVETTFRDAVEIHDLREVLEGMAARLASARISEDQLHELRDMAERIDMGVGHIADDLAFHEGLVRECGNARLIELARQFCFLGEKLDSRRAQTPFPSQPQKLRFSHTRIVEALESRNPDKAERVARAHIREGRQNLMRYYRPRRESG